MVDSAGGKKKNNLSLCLHRCWEEFDMAAGPGFRPPPRCPLPSATWPNLGTLREWYPLPWAQRFGGAPSLSFPSGRAAGLLRGPLVPSRDQCNTPPSLARVHLFVHRGKPQHWGFVGKEILELIAGPLGLKWMRRGLAWASAAPDYPRWGSGLGRGLRPLHTFAHIHMGLSPQFPQEPGAGQD